MRLTIICLSVVVVAFFCRFANAEDMLPKRIPGPSFAAMELGAKENKDILLSLFFIGGLPSSRAEYLGFMPHLLIWTDGSFLSGKIDNKTGRPVEFYTGRIEEDRIKEIVNRAQGGFRVKSNASASDLGPEASYFRLQIRSGDSVFAISTWEQFKNADVYPNHVVFSADQTKNGSPVLLPEFYENWKQCKKYLVELANELSSSAGAVPVHPVIPGGLIHPIRHVR